jgi:hypothetical protein
MEKSSEKSVVLTVGIITALATICAAVIGGAFLVINSIISQPGPEGRQPEISASTPVAVIGAIENSWVPCQEHPTYPHVIASDTTGQWKPDDGYEWVNPNDQNDLSVTWVPGEEHSEHPNIIASDEEGNWIPASGYDWANPDDENDLSVVRDQGEIESLTVEHNILENDQKGMKIHVKFTVKDLQEIRCHVTAYFYHANGKILMAKNGDPLYSTATGQVAIGEEFIPKYANSSYDDYTLLLPYEALNIEPDIEKVELKLIVMLYDWRDQSFIDQSEEYHFTYTQ